MSVLVAWLVVTCGLAFLAAAVVGYPAFMALRARGRADPVPEPPCPADRLPPLGVVLAVRDGAAFVDERLANLAGGTYPPSLLRVVLVDDASGDDTTARAAAAAGRLGLDLVVLRHERRRGKPAALNGAFAALAPEVPFVVLCDVRQRFEPGALLALVACLLREPGTGAVSGSLEIAASSSAVGGGVGRYWDLERRLRRDESRTGSCVGCTGAIYAIRRELWEPLPEDTLVDDVVVPMRVAARGHRVRFCPAAVAVDPQPLDPARERVRKRRTLAGNFQFLVRHPSWSVPGLHPLALRLFWHKTARLLVPAVLAAILLASAWLADRGSLAGAVLLLLQGAAYLLAVFGLAAGRRAPRVLGLPAAFLFLQVQVVQGAIAFLRGEGMEAWKPSGATMPAARGGGHA